MSQGLMIFIGGVLIFLSTIIPIITSILRWAMQKGVPTPLIVGICFDLVALAFVATAFIGLLRKWDVNFILSYLLVYVILYASAFVLPGGIPSRIEVALFVLSFFFLGGFVAFAISKARR